MKPTLVLAAVLFSTCAYCQDAYWVIETNPASQGKTLIKVYDLSNTLIAEREVSRRVTLASKRDKRMLNRFAEKSFGERNNVVARKSKRGKVGRAGF